MYNDLSESPGHFRFRTIWMIIGPVVYVLLLGFCLLALAIAFLDNAAGDTGAFLFVIGLLIFGGCGFVFSITAIETSSTGLKVEYLLLKSRLIPWEEINEVRIQQGRPQRCVINYGDNPIRTESFMVGHTFSDGYNTSNKLIKTIVKHAQLRPAGKSAWGGPPVYKR